MYLELRDNEWPLSYIDHDREIVRAIVYDDNYFYFVVVSRYDDFGKSTYIETSGGGIKEGEDHLEALNRELKEELGISIEVIDKIGVVSDYYNLIHRHNINHYYLCKVLAFGENHLTEAEKNDYHLKTIKLTYEEAIKAYEDYSETKIGKLVSNREIPILNKAKEIIEKKSSI